MLDAGDPAPDFELPALDGTRMRLSDALRAGPVLLTFFKSECRTSDLLFRYLPLLGEAYPDLLIRAISQDDAEESAAFARSRAISFPILLDGDGYPVSRAYDPAATPTFFLIGPEGRIELASVAFSKDDLNQASRWLAAADGADAAMIAPDDDGNPPFRPG